MTSTFACHIFLAIKYNKEKNLLGEINPLVTSFFILKLLKPFTNDLIALSQKALSSNISEMSVSGLSLAPSDSILNFAYL